MGRENELAKAVRNNNVEKVQKLLEAPRPGKLQAIRKFRSTSDIYDTIFRTHSPQAGGDADKTTAHLHADLNRSDRVTGNTPLLLATLNGYYNMVDVLLSNGADANLTDSKGNTALHLAVFNNRSDIADLLMRNSIKINVGNDDGNSPLHLAAMQCTHGRKFMLQKILKAGGRVSALNRVGCSPLDVAAQYNRGEAVSLLLDHAPQSCRGAHLALIDASVRGHAHIVRLLLEYGIDPNTLNYTRGTRALHEAVRFFRFEVIKLLLSYGADPDSKNSKMETPKSIAAEYPFDKAQRIRQLFQDYSKKPAIKPKHVHGSNMSISMLKPTVPYPLIKMRVDWTEMGSTYCNSYIKLSPHTNLLDGNAQSMWESEENTAGGVFVVLDLGENYAVSGVRVVGWDSENMAKNCRLQTSDRVSGRWETVTSFSCLRKGSNEPMQPGIPQDFRGFNTISRLWRLLVEDNHGGASVAVHQLQLFGVQVALLRFLRENRLENFANAFLERRWNTLREVVGLRQDDFDDLKFASDGDRAQLMDAIRDKRLAEHPFTKLSWWTLPTTTVVAGKHLPNFSVQADSGLFEQVQVITYTGNINGETTVSLAPQGPGRPSIAIFQGIHLEEVGYYMLEVRSVRFPWIYVRTKRQIRVVPPPLSEKQLNGIFSGVQCELSI